MFYWMRPRSLNRFSRILTNFKTTGYEFSHTTYGNICWHNDNNDVRGSYLSLVPVPYASLYWSVNHLRPCLNNTSTSDWQS